MNAFRLTADPTFFWRHGQYARAFDALRAAMLAGEAFAVLTGDAGTGKTTLVNALGQSLSDDGVVVRRLMYGAIDAGEMWSVLAHALGLDGLGSAEAFSREGRAAFRTACAGARVVVLVVDEAQALAPGALVELERLARALSRGDRPVLSVLLVGLPELSAHLESPECAGLDERISTRVEVADLSAPEVASYIRHRLEVASANPDAVPADVVSRIAAASGGTPARINQMCQALVAGVDEIPEPVKAQAPAAPRGWFDGGRWPRGRVGLVVGGAAGLAMVVFAGVHGRSAAPPPPPRAAEQRVPSPAPAAPAAVAPADAAPVERTTRAKSTQAKSTTTPTTTTPSQTTTAPARIAPPVSAATEPQRPGDQPDASDVIDWLLKDGSTKR